MRCEVGMWVKWIINFWGVRCHIKSRQWERYREKGIRVHSRGKICIVLFLGLGGIKNQRSANAARQIPPGSEYWLSSSYLRDRTRELRYHRGMHAGVCSRRTSRSDIICHAWSHILKLQDKCWCELLNLARGSCVHESVVIKIAAEILLRVSGSAKLERETLFFYVGTRQDVGNCGRASTRYIYHIKQTSFSISVRSHQTCFVSAQSRAGKEGVQPMPWHRAPNSRSS